MNTLAFWRAQLASCLFPAVIFAALVISRLFPASFLPRYDFVLLVCLTAQWAMVRWKLETWDELKVIAVFHLLGLALETYKTQVGAWEYPGAAWTKIGTVPLYSGFMYASIASYLCQAWRRLKLTLTGWPDGRLTVPLACVIYVNFFTDHFLPDIRWLATAFLIVVYARTGVNYEVNGATQRMPLLLAFGILGVAVWLAENGGTWLGAWRYPNQREGWRVVHTSKISSWFLLTVVSFLVVAQLKHVKEHVKTRGKEKGRESGPLSRPAAPQRISP